MSRVYHPPCARLRPLMSVGRVASTILFAVALFPVLSGCASHKRLSLTFDVQELPGKPAGSSAADGVAPADPVAVASSDGASIEPPSTEPPDNPESAADREKPRDIPPLSPVFFPTGRWEITPESM